MPLICSRCLKLLKRGIIMELSHIINRIVALRVRIETQILAPSDSMNEEEKLSIETWNPILKSWANELEKMKCELRIQGDGDKI